MKHSMTRLLVGVLSLIGGVLAVFNPLSASVAATTLAGWALLIVGALQAWSAWNSTGFRIKLGTGIGAAAAFVMGALLLFGSFAEGTILRIVLGIVLLISGAAKLWFSRQLRGSEMMIVLVAAGGLSLLLGLVVLGDFPAFLSGNLGRVLGLELIANGAALIVLSLNRSAGASRL